MDTLIQLKAYLGTPLHLQYPFLLFPDWHGHATIFQAEALRM
nr:MAG TPA: hypothetical protein [Caudoviricetes sp.]